MLGCPRHVNCCYTCSVLTSFRCEWSVTHSSRDAIYNDLGPTGVASFVDSSDCGKTLVRTAFSPQLFLMEEFDFGDFIDLTRYYNEDFPVTEYEPSPGLTGDNSPDSCISEGYDLRYCPPMHARLESSFREIFEENLEPATGIDASSSTRYYQFKFPSELVPQEEDSTNVVKIRGDASAKKTIRGAERSISELPQSAQPTT